MKPYRDNFETVLSTAERPHFSDAFIRTRKPPKRQRLKIRWAIEGLVVLTSVSTALWALVSVPHGARATSITLTPTPTPPLIPTPTPAAAVVAATPEPEVRRAEGVVSRWSVSWSEPIMMPYGEKIQMKLLGALPTQDDLPWSGTNQIGDAYQIGKDVFVWVKPFGAEEGKWIDPK